MKALIVVNPHAGRQNIYREIDEVRAVFAEHGEAQVVETENPAEAGEIVRRAAEAGTDVLICCGGDGTLSETVSQLLAQKAELPLGYIPAGTTNDFASFLRLPLEPVEAARHILAARPSPLDVGRFGEDRHFIYVASFGAFTKASYSADPNLKHSLGHLAYVIEGVKELPELKAHAARVETAEGEVFEGEYIFGSLSSSTSLGGVFRIDSRLVDPNDGKFELLLIKNPGNLLEFNRIAASLVSGKYDEELIVFTHTRQALFTCQEPIPWSLDGEYAPGSRQVELAVLPNAVQMYY